MVARIIDITDRINQSNHQDPIQRDKQRIKAGMDKLYSNFSGSLKIGELLESHVGEVFSDKRFAHYSPQIRCELTLFAHKYSHKLFPYNLNIESYIAQMNTDQ